MSISKKSAFTRASVLGFLALGLSTLSLNGCKESTSEPEPGPVPVITAQPTDKSYTLDVTASVTFTVTATGENLTYQWVKGNSDTIAGATSASLVLTTVTLDDNGTTYKVVVSNENGSVVSNAATLTVQTNAALYVPRVTLRALGDTVYQENCTGCHGGEGRGDRGPQVANSSFIMENRELAVALILRGNQVTPPTVDSVVVNGVLYLAGGMPAHKDFLSDRQVAGLITFIRSVWNDTLVTNCNPDSLDANSFPICVRTPRDPVAMDLDSVAVWEVRDIRDSLPAEIQ